MTILEARSDVRDHRDRLDAGAVRRRELQHRPSSAAEVWPLPRDVVVRRRRPQTRRPGGASLGYRGTGVLMSRASHRSRPITPAVTVLLALLAGGITLWLGLVAQVGAPASDQPIEMPTRLSVVEVQAGETLHSIAERVAPDVPADSVMERIRELNKLDSGAVRAGQTLIAPIG
ncbi:LysM peptidoglycan-binding domain-containing protein [Mycobacterium sp. NPDC003323]